MPPGTSGHHSLEHLHAAESSRETLAFHLGKALSVEEKRVSAASDLGAYALQSGIRVWSRKWPALPEHYQPYTPRVLGLARAYNTRRLHPCLKKRICSAVALPLKPFSFPFSVTAPLWLAKARALYSRLHHFACLFQMSRLFRESHCIHRRTHAPSAIVAYCYCSYMTSCLPPLSRAESIFPCMVNVLLTPEAPLCGIPV